MQLNSRILPKLLLLLLLRLLVVVVVPAYAENVSLKVSVQRLSNEIGQLWVKFWQEPG